MIFGLALDTFLITGVIRGNYYYSKMIDTFYILDADNDKSMIGTVIKEAQGHSTTVDLTITATSAMTLDKLEKEAIQVGKRFVVLAVDELDENPDIDRSNCKARFETQTKNATHGILTRDDLRPYLNVVACGDVTLVRKINAHLFGEEMPEIYNQWGAW